MDATEIIGKAREAMTVRRAFGEPYERNGVMIIPAAAVRGGAGGGGGRRGGGGGDTEDAETSGGSGFGLNVRPAGVYVIDGTTVRWQPAVDVNRIVAGMQVVAIVALLTLRSVLKRRRRRK